MRSLATGTHLTRGCAAKHGRLQQEMDDLTLRLHETVGELHAACKQRDSYASENVRLRDLASMVDEEDENVQPVLELSRIVGKLDEQGAAKSAALERMARVCACCHRPPATAPQLTSS